MQRQLNRVLNRIAPKGDVSKPFVEVQVMGMGESTDADFPAIYADLFDERTFDPSQGGWGYQKSNSLQDLPSFLN